MRTRPQNRPGVPVSPHIQDPALVGVHRRLLELEQRVTVLEAFTNVQFHRVSVGVNTLSALTINGTNLVGLLSLPKAGLLLDCYGWVRENLTTSGSPRGGFVALSSLDAFVGDTGDPDRILVAKNVYNTAASWLAAADKGVLFNADARVSPVISLTADTQLNLSLTPNNTAGAYGDLTTLVTGMLEFVFVVAEPL